LSHKVPAKVNHTSRLVEVERNDEFEAWDEN